MLKSMEFIFLAVCAVIVVRLFRSGPRTASSTKTPPTPEEVPLGSVELPESRLKPKE